MDPANAMNAINTVNIHGGQVSGPIAVGHQASATVNNHGVPAADGEIALLLDRLERLLAEHSDGLAEPERALRDAEDVRQELAQPDPDRSRVMDALHRLSVRAGEVTVIVEVVEQIKGLFG